MKFTKTILLAATLITTTLAPVAFASENSDALSASQKTLAIIKQDSSNLQTQLTEVNDRLLVLNEKKSDLIKAVQEADTRMQATTNEIKELEKEQTAAKGNLLAILQNTQGKIAEEIAEKKDKLSNQRFELVLAQGSLDSQESAIVKAEQEVASLKARQAENQAKVEATNQTLKKYQAAVAEEKAAAEKIAATGFAAPISGSLNVSSPFGWRTDPTGGGSEHHDGIDLTGSEGQTIMAARAGSVEMAGFDASAGNYVILKHDNGYYSYYFHLSGISVSTGQSVDTGQQVGAMGTTGDSTGTHLHFGIATGVWEGFVDPAPLIGI